MPFYNNVEEIEALIKNQWDNKLHMKIDWLGLETAIRDVLRLTAKGEISYIRALVLIDDVTAAYTRRGYALPDEWAQAFGGRL